MTLTATVAHDKNSAGVTWAASGGTLSSTSGSPVTFTAPAATSSSQTITITATSAADTSVTGTTTLTVPANLAVTTTAANLAATIGSTYSVTLAGTGGISPYTWTVTGLPSCLSYASGKITGTITNASTCAGPAGTGTTSYPLTVTMTDSGTAKALTTSTNLSLALQSAATATLPVNLFSGGIAAGSAVNWSAAATRGSNGAATTLTYSVSSGSLPDGLSLNTSTGAITGTPTKSGPFTFNVSATDNEGTTASQSYSVTIDPGAFSQIAVSAPSTATAGGKFSVTVTMEDQYGNVETNFNSSVFTISLANADSGAVFMASPPPTNGVATFDMTLTKAQSQTINATFGSFSGSKSITVNPGTLSQLAVAGPSTATAGTPISVTVKAEDTYGNLETSNTDSVAISLTNADSGAKLNSTALSSSNTVSLSGGTATFNMTLTTASTSQSITATDGSISSPSAITVNPAAASKFVLTATSGTSISAGSSVGFTVTAEDQFGNTATGYTGTVKFTSTDTGSSTVLPANSTLTSGVGSFSATLTTAGTQSITATDSSSSSITGALSGIAVSPGAASKLSISAAGSAVQGSPFNVIVSAVDAYNNTSTSTDTVTLTSSDSSASLPAAAALVNGTKTFSVTLNALGSQTITATDTTTPSVTAAQSSVTVSTLTITPTALAQGYVYKGSSYSQQLTASGGTGSYTWTISSGSLPGGLTLASSTGLISGSSTANGTASGADTYTFTVKVTDANNNYTTQSYTILTYYPVAISTSNWSSSVTVGNSYSGSLTVSGGTGAYTWTVTPSPTDADSLTYTTNNSTLTVSGTPATAETVTYSVSVSDGNVSLGPTNYTITVNALANLTVTVNQVPQGMVGMPYTFGNFNVNGSSNYSITYSGAPSWATTDSNGHLVGTPDAAATTKSVTVTATDNNTKNYGTATFDLPVVAASGTTHNGYLKGQYACYVNKYMDQGVYNSDNQAKYYHGGALFAFSANGGGGITGGEMDINTPSDGYVSNQSISSSSSYAVGSDNRGYLSLTVGSSGSAVLALAGGNLNSSSVFSELAITEMDDAGTSPSGQHGGGHCYLQNTTSLSSSQPSGNYVFGFSGEDSSGDPESMVGYISFDGNGKITGGAQDMVENVTVRSGSTMVGTTSGTADSYGRMTMTAGPTADQEGPTVMYLTNNTKGQVLMMSGRNHTATGDDDFIMGEAREQIAIPADEPLAGNGVMYAEGPVTTADTSTSPATYSNTYKALVAQFTGNSTQDQITINTQVKNSGGTVTKDSGDMTGHTLSYVPETTGRITITGQTGIYFYVYNNTSAVALFADSKTSGSVENLIGWIEPQTAPTTWALSDVDNASYFMSKIDNGDYNSGSQSSILAMDSSGIISNFAEDDGGQQWASWQNGMGGSSSSTVTGAVSLDAADLGNDDSSYGVFDVKVTSVTPATTMSYCYAISEDAAAKSGAMGRLVCIDANSGNNSGSPKLSILQE
jgi:hypothetical protein